MQRMEIGVGKTTCKTDWEIGKNFKKQMKNFNAARILQKQRKIQEGKNGQLEKCHNREKDQINVCICNYIHICAYIHILNTCTYM